MCAFFQNPPRHNESSSSASEEERTMTQTNHAPGDVTTQETKIDEENGRSKPGIVKRRRRTKESNEMKRERKAWRTLAIITGNGNILELSIFRQFLKLLKKFFFCFERIEKKTNSNSAQNQLEI